MNSQRKKVNAFTSELSMLKIIQYLLKLHPSERIFLKFVFYYPKKDSHFRLLFNIYQEFSIVHYFPIFEENTTHFKMLKNFERVLPVDQDFIFCLMMKHRNWNTPSSLPWYAPVWPSIHHFNHGIQCWSRNKFHFFQQFLQWIHKSSSVRESRKNFLQLPFFILIQFLILAFYRHLRAPSLPAKEKLI